MTADAAKLRAMRPSEVLDHVRDSLIGSSLAYDSGDRASIGRAAACASGADVITAIIAFGQEVALQLQQKSSKPAWVKSASDEARWKQHLVERQGWARELADQARAALLSYCPRDDTEKEKDEPGTGNDE